MTRYKPVVHPEKLSLRLEGWESPIRNPSFARWKAELETAGVRVVDVAPLLAAGLLTGAGSAMAAGNPEAGKAQAIVCAACHGQDGATGIDPTYPNLAGQNEAYLFNQLRMIQSGERQILLMAGQLIGSNTQSTLIGAGVGTLVGAIVGNAVDQESRIAREAAATNRRIVYYDDEQDHAIEAIPGPEDEQTKCRKVTKREWDKGYLVSERVEEICEGEKVSRKY